MRRLGLPVVLLAAATLAAAGCDSRTAYDTRWHDTSVVYASAQAQPLTGKWQGSWQSNDSDYNWGLAKAIISPLDSTTTKDGLTATRYEAHIQLYHFWVFTEEFRVYLTAVPGPEGKLNLSGERVLTPVDGAERFDGSLDGDRFFLTYSSTKDYGTYVFRRLTKDSPDTHAAAWGPEQNTH